MKTKYEFILNSLNKITYHQDTGLNSNGHVATIDCDHDDALLIANCMQMAINAKLEQDKRKSDPPGRYSVIKN